MFERALRTFGQLSNTKFVVLRGYGSHVIMKDNVPIHFCKRKTQFQSIIPSSTSYDEVSRMPWFLKQPVSTSKRQNRKTSIVPMTRQTEPHSFEFLILREKEGVWGFGLWTKPIEKDWKVIKKESAGMGAARGVAMYSRRGNKEG